jgi:hypothetical protein
MLIKTDELRDTSGRSNNAEWKVYGQDISNFRADYSITSYITLTTENRKTNSDMIAIDAGDRWQKYTYNK